MENWTIEKIKELKELNETCTEEIALSRYIGCMIRLVNGMAQMHYSQFHYYEKIILWHAMDIFTGHFIEQINQAQTETKVREKRDLIDDIEDAVERMTGVYQNVINSTANSDRQMLSGVSVDTSIYELSPKLCAFYSNILNKLVALFGEERDYAFVLHPTLKNNTETRIMFERRKKSGKVVIIYISESIIEDVDTVSVFLLHEAFHVLTKEERLRKERLGFYIQMLLSGMKQLLFKDVTFFDDAKKEKKIKEYLIEKFFSTIKTERENWKEKDEREYYGSKAVEWSKKYFYDRFSLIYNQIEEWIQAYTIQDFNFEISFKTYSENSEKELNAINNIKSNIFNIIYNHDVSKLAEKFMFICREIYADISCILVLELQMADYERAFAKSKQFKFDSDNFRDTVQEFRDYIVTNTVAKYLPEEIAQTWQIRVKMVNISAQINENRLTSPNGNVIIGITPEIKSAFLDYAKKCAGAFQQRLQKINNIDSFRQKMKKIRSEDKISLLEQIMVGDFNMLFDEYKKFSFFIPDSG